MGKGITFDNFTWEYEKGMDVITDPSDAYDNGWKEGREDLIQYIKDRLTNSLNTDGLTGDDLMLDVFNILTTLKA